MRARDLIYSLTDNDALKCQVILEVWSNSKSYFAYTEPNLTRLLETGKRAKYISWPPANSFKVYAEKKNRNLIIAFDATNAPMPDSIDFEKSYRVEEIIVFTKKSADWAQLVQNIRRNKEVVDISLSPAKKTDTISSRSLCVFCRS